MARDDTRVQAVVGLAPPNDLVADNERRGGLSRSMQSLFGFGSTNIDDKVRAKLKENSPITHITPELPPFLLIQGDMDKTVLYQHSLNFQAKLLENHVPCEFIVVKGAGHRILDWNKFDPAWASRMAGWLQAKLETK